MQWFRSLLKCRQYMATVLPHILDSNAIIGLKRRGEVGQKPFQDVCMHKFSAQDWELRSVELNSLWQDKVNNPNWHSFKQAAKDGKMQIDRKKHIEETSQSKSSGHIPDQRWQMQL